MSVSKENDVNLVDTDRARYAEQILANATLGKALESHAPQIITYEELSCIGYNPSHSLLEATVLIKRSGGYKGNLCKRGSHEYVRFYVNYGSGWEDVGLSAFNVHDIPTQRDKCTKKATKPLCYTLNVRLKPKRRYCKVAVLPAVRAILSWEVMPPAGQPNWKPYYGNVLNTHIQIKPRKWFVGDLVGKITQVDPDLLKLFAEVADKPIPQPDPGPLALAELADLYQGVSLEAVKGGGGGQTVAVEAHRFGFAQLMSTKAAAANPETVQMQVAEWAQLDFNYADVLAGLEKTKGNVSYEELECLGLDYNRNWLGATFRVKKSSGFSGGLCTKGSKEYVAFWVQRGKCKWEYMGSAETITHDISPLPKGGLHYSAILPVNLRKRLSCKRPQVVRLRAVLSWNTPASTTDPDAIPHWGNRLDTYIQIKPRVKKKHARISILGGIGIADIDTAGDGRTKTQAKFALQGTFADPHSPSRACPFGGRVVVQGSRPAGATQYRLLVRQGAAAPSRLTSKIWVTNQGGVGSWHYPDVNGFFDYLSDNLNVNNVLGYWNTGLENGVWQIKLEAANNANVIITTTPWYRLRLDNTKPTAKISIDGGACHQYKPGAVLTGKFTAYDPHFGRYSIAVLPSSMSPNATTPNAGITQTPISGSVWSLDTGSPKMKPCGYVIKLYVHDRTIRNSGPSGHNYKSDDVGFCLV